jgi:hypothetical protein
VGFGGIQGVPSVCIGITLKVGVASLVIIGHGGEGGFMGEVKRGGAVVGVGEAVNFGFDGFARVVIRFRRGGGRWVW